MFTLDSNVLIYTVTLGDPRQDAAIGILDRAARGNGVLTLQSLGEFFTVAARKALLPRTEVAAQVRRWLAAFPVPISATTQALSAALEANLAGRFGYWDALLVATAGLAGCTAVISEDMAPGATLAGARIVPAFAANAISPEALAALG